MMFLLKQGCQSAHSSPDRICYNFSKNLRIGFSGSEIVKYSYTFRSSLIESLLLLCACTLQPRLNPPPTVSQMKSFQPRRLIFLHCIKLDGRQILWISNSEVSGQVKLVFQRLIQTTRDSYGVFVFTAQGSKYTWRGEKRKKKGVDTFGNGGKKQLKDYLVDLTLCDPVVQASKRLLWKQGVSATFRSCKRVPLKMADMYGRNLADTNGWKVAGTQFSASWKYANTKLKLKLYHKRHVSVENYTFSKRRQTSLHQKEKSAKFHLLKDSMSANLQPCRKGVGKVPTLINSAKFQPSVSAKLRFPSVKSSQFSYEHLPDQTFHKFTASTSRDRLIYVVRKR